MSQRPEILYPLFAELTTLPGVGPKSAEAFAKAGIEHPRDLLYHLPSGVLRRKPVETVEGEALPATLTVEVEVLRHLPPRQRGRPYRIQVRDARTTFTLVYFHANTARLEALFPVGARRIVSGKVEMFDHLAQMVHPDHVVIPGSGEEIPLVERIYPLPGGLTQRSVQRAVDAALARAPELPEWISHPVLSKQEWQGWRAALTEAHAPRRAEDCLPDAPARLRLAYDELFAHQLTLALARQHRRRRKGRETRGDGRLRKAALAALPYELTTAQRRALAEIEADMGAPRRMNRLLQGDVGSGKTVVAFLGLLIAVEAGGQGVLMAPTEVLARQHHDELRPYAEAAGVRLEILTGRDRGAERARKLEALAAGEIDILIGTHSVFQSDVAFADLRLAIVDEQHRFGVRERLSLGEKGAAVDMLVMTATPIPRSLALATYGDMDLSVLDEKPPGRKPVRTVLVSQSRLPEVVERLRAAVSEGRQAFWVCPLVGESEARDWAAAEERFEALRAELGEDVVGLVHGQMPAEERDRAMARFAAGETKVLVATTVIEVGVNVPNATIMIIEQAETFGLAQLHQLRGRVGRGEKESVCVLLHGPLGKTAEARLKALRDTNDGFRLAEVDLRLRGAGDLLGVAQSGLPRFAVADIETHAELLELAQDDARRLLYEDPALQSERGRAARTLLWLMRMERAFRYLSAG